MEVLGVLFLIGASIVSLIYFAALVGNFIGNVRGLVKKHPKKTAVGGARSIPEVRQPNLVSSSSATGSQRKPVGARLWGETYVVKHWIRVLILVLERLHARHGPEEFDRILAHGSRPLVSRDVNHYSRPIAVGSTGVYINRSIPITEIRRRAFLCLERFGHPTSDLEILFE
ncbi:MAG: hypothetical protein OXF41_11020 [bacterium]|nr:hypothetical protein [bacterium]